MNQITREEWLQKAIHLLDKEVFAIKNYTVPKVHISIGFSARLRNARTTLGVCFDASASKDNIHQIFISPIQDDSSDILATLTHELVHAIVGVQEGHGKQFRKCALSVGLRGPMRTTTASEELKQKFNQIIERIGPIPHSKININNKKKQSTRLIKCQCLDCGYTARTTAFWIEKAGTPLCPSHNTPMQSNLKKE